MFKRILKILPAVCLAASMAWAAQSPFIGEWKLDPSKTRMPDEMKIQSEGGDNTRSILAGRRDDRRWMEAISRASAARCCR